MSAHWQPGEVSLRRKRLFQLLKGFDFDNPVRRREPILEPIVEETLEGENSEDIFVFAFEDKPLEVRMALPGVPVCLI